MTEEKRPFHETIIDAIERCNPSPSGEILPLFNLIKQTKIPANHDKIISAIKRYFNFTDGGKLANELNLVIESLLEQKKEAGEKKDTKAEAVTEEHYSPVS